MAKYRYKRMKRNRAWINEHQWVWQQANGPVPEGYEIHHRNLDGLDNRLENLEVMLISEHRSLHAKKPPRYCSVPGCGKIHEARGWCKMHWYRWRRTGDPLGIQGQRGTPAHRSRAG